MRKNGYKNSTFHTTASLTKKSQWKVQVNVMTPQELGVCGESSEINGEKNVLFSIAEKKFFWLLKRSE